MSIDSERLGPLLHLRPGSAPRVVIISASYGAGHNSASREISRVLEEAGCDVEILDFVDLMPWRLGRGLKLGYKMQLQVSPDSWGTTMSMVMPGGPLHRLFAQLLRLSTRPIIEATRGADLVVSTHPFCSQVIGELRTTGQLTTPAVTYLTDAAVPALWIHPGIDLNLALHEVAAREARLLGGNASVVQALVPAGAEYVPGRAFPDPLSDLQLTGPRALVTGGSLGAGALEQTARDILTHSDMTPVVLCATDRFLKRRLERIPGVVALGWRTDVRALMATSDCVVQNAGGFTSLEALASGTPVITYRSISGHGAANSANLDRAGLIPWARDEIELAKHLVVAAESPRFNRLALGFPDLVQILTGSLEETAVA
ncbi:galactosyldiacylglycerol synthase [Nocardioides sp.]|uniref:MGDG synthase family glycosyltransferase n=1 Tax=Nocardioides sp. TaxID=35761 RepID=UPI0019A2B8EF|nr:galactosyldiacylglycerol synthase [Nocardioides sp.]MBC7276202.1 glycosyltransferase [Nocardioides sp.]